jgi:hypothetical protein
MRDDHAVNRAEGGDGNGVHDSVMRPTQILDARDERDIELAAREFCTKRGWMIEFNRPGPAVNQRPGVEVFYAADFQGA